MDTRIINWIKYCQVNSITSSLFCQKVGSVACGVKPCELINVNPSQLRQCYQLEDIILIKEIYKIDFTTKVLIYHQNSLEQILNKPDIKRFLLSLGYPIDSGINQVINHLTSLLKNKNNFPHEIGVFLGYPLKDVLGFMGLNDLSVTKTLGWQVYGNPKDSEQIYSDYKSIKQQISDIISLQ